MTITINLKEYGLKNVEALASEFYGQVLDKAMAEGGSSVDVEFINKYCAEEFQKALECFKL